MAPQRLGIADGGDPPFRIALAEERGKPVERRCSDDDVVGRVLSRCLHRNPDDHARSAALPFSAGGDATLALLPDRRRRPTAFPTLRRSPIRFMNWCG